jgi:DeoR/GlpR family transcriptional regulator of sugar metabolism
MNPNPRQIKLLSTVRAQGSVTVERLADVLDVTLQTVRRDVQRLADEGLLARFHGGVRVPGSTVENLAYPQREILNAQGKARIARAVADAVPNGCSLLLNIGTTTEAIARALGLGQPPLAALVAELRAQGFNASASAVMAGQLRSDAPWPRILETARGLLATTAAREVATSPSTGSWPLKSSAPPRCSGC